MKCFIDGVKYDTNLSSLLAHDRFWDGSNWERNGRNTYLYRSNSHGKYFVQCITCYEGERDSIIPLNVQEAKDLYEKLPIKEENF